MGRLREPSALEIAHIRWLWSIDVVPRPKRSLRDRVLAGDLSVDQALAIAGLEASPDTKTKIGRAGRRREVGMLQERWERARSGRGGQHAE